MGIIIINSYAFGASASGGFSLSDTTDVAPHTGNPMASGDTVTVTNSASGHSTCTFSFAIGSDALTVGTLSDMMGGGRPDILAWKSNSNPSSGADITENGTVISDLVGTWYFKITNNAEFGGGTATSGETVTVTQTVDSSIVTTVTFTVA